MSEDEDYLQSYMRNIGLAKPPQAPGAVAPAKPATPSVSQPAAPAVEDTSPPITLGPPPKDDVASAAGASQLSPQLAESPKPPANKSNDLVGILKKILSGGGGSDWFYNSGDDDNE